MTPAHPRVFIVVLALAFWSILASWCIPDDGNGSARLRHESSISRDSPQMVTSVEVSRDERFLYAAAWQAAAITVFQRDMVTGELTHVQQLVLAFGVPSLPNVTAAE